MVLDPKNQLANRVTKDVLNDQKNLFYSKPSESGLASRWTEEKSITKKARKERKPYFIPLNLPRKNLAKLTANLARRYNISPRAQTAFLSKIVR